MWVKGFKKHGFWGTCLLGMLIPTVVGAQDLLVSSWAGNSIRRYDVTTGDYLGDFISPFDGGLSLPDGYSYGPDGNFYVSSANTDQILRYDGQTGDFIDVFASEGLDRPSYHTFGPDGHLYVCNANFEVVSRFDGQIGDPMGVFAEGGGLDFPAGLLWRDNELFVASFTGGDVLRYNATSGDFIDSFTTEPNNPLYLRFDDDGNLAVSAYAQNTIRTYDGRSGALLGSIAHFTLSGPVGQLIVPDGSLLVASWNNHRIIRFNAQTGAFIEIFAQGDGLLQPNDLLLMLPAPCPQDLNGDGGVGPTDLSQLLVAWGSGAGYPADFDGDGNVGPVDLSQLLVAWGQCP